MVEEVTPVIIDNGSGLIKDGFGGEEPSLVVPSIVGYLKLSNWINPIKSNYTLWAMKQSETVVFYVKSSY